SARRCRSQLDARTTPSTGQSIRPSLINSQLFQRGCVILNDLLQRVDDTLTKLTLHTSRKLNLSLADHDDEVFTALKHHQRGLSGRAISEDRLSLGQVTCSQGRDPPPNR